MDGVVSIIIFESCLASRSLSALVSCRVSTPLFTIAFAVGVTWVNETLGKYVTFLAVVAQDGVVTEHAEGESGGLLCWVCVQLDLLLPNLGRLLGAGEKKKLTCCEVGEVGDVEGRVGVVGDAGEVGVCSPLLLIFTVLLLPVLSSVVEANGLLRTMPLSLALFSLPSPLFVRACWIGTTVTLVTSALRGTGGKSSRGTSAFLRRTAHNMAAVRLEGPVLLTIEGFGEGGAIIGTSFM